MKGHFFSLSRLMDSSVCGSRPCMMSTTRMAMSHSELPRFLRLLQEPRGGEVQHLSSTDQTPVPQGGPTVFLNHMMCC